MNGSNQRASTIRAANAFTERGACCRGCVRHQSVTAPRDAGETSAVYFASTPRV